MQLKEYFRMLRVKDWIKSTLWIPFIGAFLAHTSLQNFILIAVVYFCVTAYAFVVNNYFDVEIDRQHKRKKQSNVNPLANGFVAKKSTLMLIGVLLSISIFLSLQINFIGFVFVLLSLLSSTLYSVKYIRLKEKPGLDIITSGFMFGFFPFLAGLTLAGGIINFPFIVVGILFTILSINGLLTHQIVDYYDDLGNTNNLTLKIGREKSFILSLFLILISLLFFELVLVFFSIQWYFHFLIILFLLFCFPVRFINQFYKEKIKGILMEGLLLPNVIYENRIKVYQSNIKKIFFE